ncbi:MAG: antibiotic biosynthesis monooxygenase family protein [Desulfobulbus sp.]|jgi:heme-degrading monooxygenase HmoA
MIVRVIMTRQIARRGRTLDTSLLPILSEMLIELRSMANRQPGYISGETLRNVYSPEEYVVISTWLSFEAWENWFANERRAELEGKIDAMLGSPTTYKIYEYY